MTESLPYLASPGSIKSALEKIRTAATPARVTQDFIQTKLQIKGGTGAALIPFLKKIGFVATDGAPTELYKRFRNAEVGGTAVAEAIKYGYKPLSQINEYFYELGDKELLALIIQVTGLEDGNQVAKLTLSTLKQIRPFANFDATLAFGNAKSETTAEPKFIEVKEKHDATIKKVGLNLSYTINLNLPATTDQAVFNAIFRSLKEHLLENDN